MNGTLTAFYDLAHGPISYDFVAWLIRALIECKGRRCDRLHVVVVPKEDGVGGFSRDWGGYGESEARWRLWHIIAGVVPLAGATLTIAPSRAMAEDLRRQPVWWPEGKAHMVAPIVAYAREGGLVPLLRPTVAARAFVGEWLGEEKRPVVTLTERRHAHGPVRNTDPFAWAQFADWLRGKGYAVITLEDTVRALNAGRGYAELDVDLRLALYERAAMNVIGRNGPVALLWFSRAPYLAFDSARTNDDPLMALHGLKPDEQMPWAQPNQRETFAPDTFGAMRDEFQAWASATN